MKRKWIRSWFGPCLLSVAAGCSQTRTLQTTPAPMSPLSYAGSVTPGAPVAWDTRSSASGRAGSAGSPYAHVPDSRVAYNTAAPAAAQQVLVPEGQQVPPVSYTEPQGMPAAPYRMPAGEPVAQANYTENQQLAPPPGRLPIQEPAPLAAEETAPKTISPRAEPEPRRRSYIDVTASPCFGHTPDYAQLSGQVEYSRLSKGWRLRYASVDEIDRFGGCVTLVENGNLDQLKDGQFIMVQGHLSNPEETGSSPPFRVDSFRVIEKPNSADQSVTPK